MNRVYNRIKKLGIVGGGLDDVLKNTVNFYRVYFIPKKNSGEKRMICAPSEGMLALQNAVLPCIKKLRKSRFCAAYEKGCSTKNNAKYHSKRKFILHADIKNFFGSIDKECFLKTYRKKFNDEETEMLWSICSYKGGLPIGSPASPFISNRIMRRIDKKLKRIAPFVKYTRYADDMVFSSNRYFDKKNINKVADILKKNGFLLNYSKTYFMNSRREVTGIIIKDNNKLSAGTAFKKRLKKDLYDFLVKNKGKKDCLKGKMAYLYNIEPVYTKKIIAKYSKFDMINFFG